MVGGPRALSPKHHSVPRGRSVLCPPWGAPLRWDHPFLIFAGSPWRERDLARGVMLHGTKLYNKLERPGGREGGGGAERWDPPPKFHHSPSPFLNMLTACYIIQTFLNPPVEACLGRHVLSLNHFFISLSLSPPPLPRDSISPFFIYLIGISLLIPLSSSLDILASSGARLFSVKKGIHVQN